MNVMDLMVRLQAMNPHDIVVIQKDDEGNGYREARYLLGGNTVFTDGEVKFTSLSVKQIKAGFGVADMYDGDDAKHCVVIS